MAATTSELQAALPAASSPSSSLLSPPLLLLLPPPLLLLRSAGRPAAVVQPEMTSLQAFSGGNEAEGTSKSQKGDPGGHKRSGAKEGEGGQRVPPPSSPNPWALLSGSRMQR